MERQLEEVLASQSLIANKLDALVVMCNSLLHLGTSPLLKQEHLHLILTVLEEVIGLARHPISEVPSLSNEDILARFGTPPESNIVLGADGKVLFPTFPLFLDETPPP